MDELSTKLRTLKYQLQEILNKPGRFYDPPKVLFLFDNFLKYQTKLKELLPTLFDDTPLIEIPIPSKTSDFEGRGYITREKLEELLQFTKSSRMLLASGENNTNTDMKNPPNDFKIMYIDEGIVNAFSQKNGPFNYKKLISLLIELNFNYSQQNIYASAALIRAILDHIPPLVGHITFETVVNNKWSDAHRKYIQSLLNFKGRAHDALHTQISSRQDHLSMDDLPIRVEINTMLEACLEKGNLDDFTSAKSKAEEQTKKTPKITVNLLEERTSWDHYGVGRYVWDSFNFRLFIDNCNSSKPDYLSISLKAKNGDDVWVAPHFIFETTKPDLDVPFEIGAGKQERIGVTISNNTPDTGRYSFPDIDRNTLELVVNTRSGEEIIIPIKAGWIQG